LRERASSENLRAKRARVKTESLVFIFNSIRGMVKGKVKMGQ
jgi:hypothetical protein